MFFSKYLGIYMASMDYLFLHGGSNVTVRIHREGYETGYSCFCAENSTWSWTQGNHIKGSDYFSFVYPFLLHTPFIPLLIASMEQSQIAF